MYQAENPLQTEKQLQRGGFDGGCEIGFACRYTPAFDEVKQVLEKAKEQAAEKGEKIRAIIGGYTVFVEPAGANVGLRYRWVFVSGGVRFYVHNNDKVAQPVRVKYCAEALIGQNFYAVHAVILEFLRSLGCVITEEKISRVDLQVLVDKDISEFVLAILRGCSVARSEVDKVHRVGGKIETYTLGCSGRLQLCIYDKHKELLKEQVSNPVKYMMVLTECIGLEWFMYKPITRVEFRLWRDVLRNLDIHSVKDLQEKEYALVDWLTSHWFRILNETKVRGSENHQDILPLWRETDNFKSRDNYKIQNSHICLCICKSNSFRKRNACRFKV
ncbi:hypothetical protein FACS189427_08150 [Planctomycetales bacterium]|nr:hypothetical protein FACS189427_08150 [Planctomycetales bacterium]